LVKNSKTQKTQKTQKKKKSVVERAKLQTPLETRLAEDTTLY
jgi:hypothetical protein